MCTLVLTTYSPLMYMRAIHSGDSCARDRVSHQIFGEWPGSATCTQPLSHWISCGQCSSSASEWLTEYPGQSATDSVSWWIRWGGDWLNPGSGEPWKGWSTSSYAIVDRPLDQWTSGPTYKRHCRALPLTPPTGQHFPTKGHPGQTLIWEPMVTCFDQDKRNFG